MRNRSLMLVAIVALALVASPACVSKKLFRTNAEEGDTRVGSVETAVEANERRIADLREETDDKLSRIEQQSEEAVEVGTSAMVRAEAAEQAARGKLLWEVTLTDERVKFPFGDSTLPDDSRAVLGDLAERVMSYGKAVYIEIEGHTDSTGSDDYNRTLGLRRADAVRNYLNEGGVPLHAMNTISYGEARPVDDNSTPAGRSKNRRVVIRVLE